MKALIIINGRARSGKNTVMDILKRDIIKGGSYCTTLEYHDSVMPFIKSLTGWDMVERTEADRRLICDVINAFDDHSNAVLLSSARRIRTFFDSYKDGVAIISMRGNRKIQMLRDLFKKDQDILTRYVIVQSVRCQHITSNTADAEEPCGHDYLITNNTDIMGLEKSCSSLMNRLYQDFEEQSKL